MSSTMQSLAQVQGTTGPVGNRETFKKCSHLVPMQEAGLYRMFCVTTGSDWLDFILYESCCLLNNFTIL
jgi:hypothetical protein